MPPGNYLTPPIQEAICEFRFAPGKPWDLQVAFELYAALRDTYSGPPRHVIVANPAPSPPYEFPQPMQGAIAPRIQLTTQNNTQILGVGEDVLSVSVLRPYPGWESFRASILSALATYAEIAQPVGITRIGVRYINNIAIPGDSVDLDDYFLSGPKTPSGMPPHIGPFLVRFVSAFPDLPDSTLTYHLANITADAPITIVMDLDVAREWPGSYAAITDAPALVEELRDHERTVFESAITDAARELFDAPTT